MSESFSYLLPKGKYQELLTSFLADKTTHEQISLVIEREYPNLDLPPEDITFMTELAMRGLFAANQLLKPVVAKTPSFSSSEVPITISFSNHKNDPYNGGSTNFISELHGEQDWGIPEEWKDQIEYIQIKRISIFLNIARIVANVHRMRELLAEYYEDLYFTDLTLEEKKDLLEVKAMTFRLEIIKEVEESMAHEAGHALDLLQATTNRKRLYQLHKDMIYNKQYITHDTSRVLTDEELKDYFSQPSEKTAERWKRWFKKAYH